MSVKRVAIIGSGIMGSGITEAAAASGHDVVLRSRSKSTADAMLAGLEKSLNKQIDRGKRTAEERDEILSRVTTTSDFHALADCDLVIESVVEDLKIKKELFVELDRVSRPGHHAGHQHLHASRWSSWRWRRVAPKRVRHPLLQPRPRR